MTNGASELGDGRADIAGAEDAERRALLLFCGKNFET
jgi:hypothetical protein